MAVDLSPLTELSGFIAACLVDIETGLVLATENGRHGLDLDIAGAASVDVIRAKRGAMSVIGCADESIEDIVVTLSNQYHLLHPLEGNHDAFLFLAIDKRASNLGMARIKLKSVEGTLKL